MSKQCQICQSSESIKHSTNEINAVKRLWLMSLIMGLFIAPAFADDEDYNGHKKNQVTHLYNDVDLISTTKIEYGKPRLVVKAVYPQIEMPYSDDAITNFNELIQNQIQGDIADFTTRVMAKRDGQINLPKKSVKNNLVIDFDTSLIKSGKNHLISIRFSIQGTITGVSEPYHVHRSFNYNLDTGDEILLSDLFAPGAGYLEALSSYSAGVLDRRFSDKRLLLQGTQPTPENFQSWNIKPNGILITFEEGQVAPAINGAQTVLIPFRMLDSILSPDSPMKNCINHGKSCRSNNSLTGGFIDEAFNAHHRSLDPILS